MPEDHTIHNPAARWNVGDLLRHPIGSEWKLIEHVGGEDDDWRAECLKTHPGGGSVAGSRRVFHREYMDRTFSRLQPSPEHIADSTEQVEDAVCESCEKRLPRECAAIGVEGEALCGACVAGLDAPILKAAWEVVTGKPGQHHANLKRLRDLLDEGNVFPQQTAGKALADWWQRGLRDVASPEPKDTGTEDATARELARLLEIEGHPKAAAYLRDLAAVELKPAVNNEECDRALAKDSDRGVNSEDTAPDWATPSQKEKLQEQIIDLVSEVTAPAQPLEEVQRWNTTKFGMAKAPNGGYVDFDDHDRVVTSLQQRLEELNGDFEQITESLQAESNDNFARALVLEKRLGEALTELVELRDWCRKWSRASYDDDEPGSRADGYKIVAGCSFWNRADRFLAALGTEDSEALDTQQGEAREETINVSLNRDEGTALLLELQTSPNAVPMGPQMAALNSAHRKLLTAADSPSSQGLTERQKQRLEIAMKELGCSPNNSAIGHVVDDCALVHMDYLAGIDLAAGFLAEAIAEITGETAPEVSGRLRPARQCDCPAKGCGGPEHSAKVREEYRARLLADLTPEFRAAILGSPTQSQLTEEDCSRLREIAESIEASPEGAVPTAKEDAAFLRKLAEGKPSEETSDTYEPGDAAAHRRDLRDNLPTPETWADREKGTER